MLERLNPIIINAPQRSEQWFKSRLGNLTASKAECPMAYGKPTQAQLTQAHATYAGNLECIDDPETYEEFVEYINEMADKYPVKFCLDVGIELYELNERMKCRQELVAERITGQPADPEPYVSYDMKWGIINEQHARYYYETHYPVKVSDAPLMLHPKLLCGASPDGLVIDTETGELGNLEIKCLRSSNHLYKVIRDGEMPDDYFAQVQMQMWIDGRDWCDFVGFDSRVQEGLEVLVTRIKIDWFYLENVFVPMLTTFLEECDADERQFYAIRKSNLAKRGAADALQHSNQ